MQRGGFLSLCCKKEQTLDVHVLLMHMPLTEPPGTSQLRSPAQSQARYYALILATTKAVKDTTEKSEPADVPGSATLSPLGFFVALSPHCNLKKFHLLPEH